MYKYEPEILSILLDGGWHEEEEIASSLSLEKEAIQRPLQSLLSRGLIEEKLEKIEKGFEYVEMPIELKFASTINGKDVKTLTNDEKKAFGLGKKLGIFSLQDGKVTVNNKILEEAISSYKEKKKDKYFEIWKKRKLVKELVKIKKYYRITLSGRNFVKKQEEGITQLTQEILESGKEIKLKPYNLSIPAGKIRIGRRHIISEFTNFVKEIFVEMGFEEMEGSYVEHSFWNFDALFQPQDHPARDLADTFYLPFSFSLPKDKELIERVKNTHERWWHYSWKEEMAKKGILRTHTTVLSARTLYWLGKQKKKEGRFFAVGKVFRNEAIDYKHLAEFHQIEGIVVSEKANFSHLLSILKEFYRKMGFEKIRFRPSYFPYTEPSLEIEVFFEKKNSWIELGGAGIFRRQVSIPLANVYPVLAFGLSVERLLMLILDLDDIRIFYENDLRKELRLRL